MPVQAPRVTYWTGTWDPSREAISKQIEALRVGPRFRAPVVAYSPANPLRWQLRKRVLTLPAGFWPMLRGAAALLEPRGDVTHVFGGHVSWHLLRSLGRRPVLLTASVPRAEDARLPPGPIARVVVETEGSIPHWVKAGIPQEQIEVIPPGIDLEWFSVMPPPRGSGASFTLLFASTPSQASEIDSRGIPLLVEVARLRPDIQIIIPWRSWASRTDIRQALSALRPPNNLVVTFGDLPDVRTAYRGVHATILCFEKGAGKDCPNFVLEGLACGRPCVAVSESGVGALIRASGAGATADRDPQSLVSAIECLRADLAGYSKRARQLAERHFDLRTFRARYEALYQSLTGS